MSLTGRLRHALFRFMTGNGGMEKTFLGGFGAKEDLQERARAHLLNKEAAITADNYRQMWVLKESGKAKRQLRELKTDTHINWVTNDLERILKVDRLKLQIQLEDLKANKSKYDASFYEKKLNEFETHLKNFDQEVHQVREESMARESKAWVDPISKWFRG